MGPKHIKKSQFYITLIEILAFSLSNQQDM